MLIRRLDRRSTLRLWPYSDEQYLIPYVQAALAINPDIELWGSSWTPPAFG